MLGVLVSVVSEFLELCVTTVHNSVGILQWFVTDLLPDVTDYLSDVVSTVKTTVFSAVDFFLGVWDVLLTLLVGINVFFDSVLEKGMAASAVVFRLLEFVYSVFYGVIMQLGVAVGYVYHSMIWLAHAPLTLVSFLGNIVTTALHATWILLSLLALAVLLSCVCGICVCMCGGIPLVIKCGRVIKRNILPPDEQRGLVGQQIGSNNSRPASGLTQQRGGGGGGGGRGNITSRGGAEGVPRRRNVLSQPGTPPTTPTTPPTTPTTPPSHPPSSPPAASATAQEEETPDNQLCIVCMANKKSVLLRPCRHYCVCDLCSPMLNGVCPICRTNVTSTEVVHIYYD